MNRWYVLWCVLVLLASPLSSCRAWGANQAIYSDDASNWWLEPYACLSWYGRDIQGPRLECASSRSGVCFAADGETLHSIGQGSSSSVMEIPREGPALILAGMPSRPGYADGPAELARFGGHGIMGMGRIISDRKGGYYIADWGNQCVRHLFKKDGKKWWVETTAGEPSKGLGWEEWRDGDLQTARFRCVQTLALDGKGNIYVLDTNRIRYVDLAARKVTTLNPDWGNKKYCYGFQDGPLSGAKFSWIMCGCCDIDREANLLYVADSWNKRLRKVDLASKTASTVFHGKRSKTKKDGTMEEATTGPCHDVQWDPFRKRLILKEMDCAVLRVIDLEKRTVRSWVGTYDRKRKDLVRKGKVPYPMTGSTACLNYVAIFNIGEKDVYLGPLGKTGGGGRASGVISIGRLFLKEE